MVHTKLVILLHGYFKTDLDMSVMKHYLDRRGYRSHIVGLPTTFGSLEECTRSLEKKLAQFPTRATSFSFVGHSMGGLIIRQYLSQNIVPNIGRCVLISTPNAGSRLADIALDILRFSPINPLKSLDCLKTSRHEIPQPLNCPPPDIGVIAGNNNNLILGKLLLGENDGRVEVESMKFSGMKDFAVLPFGHLDIHYQEKTAELVDRFIKKGTFHEAE